MDISLIEENVEHIVEPMVNELGYEYVGVEFVEEEGDWYLRVYIDKEDGISVEDCAYVSRPLSDKLDEIDPIDESYFFEVSSPGVNRIIKKDKDFEKYKNSKIRIMLLSPYEDKEFIEGILKGLEDNKNSIIIDHDKKIINIDRKNVKAVNLIEI